jgi:hypothetical protein
MRFLRLSSGILAAAIVVVACGSNDPATPSSTDGSDAGTSTTDGVDASTGNKGQDGGSTTPPAATYSIGGTVTGLKGTGLVLQDNSGDDLAIGADGTFTFSKKLAKGATYAVSIKTQPTAPSQTCTLSAESGVVQSSNVTGVVVNCAANTFTVGGTVSGLAGGSVTLQNNGGADLVVNANGTFAFPTPIASGTTYVVTVKTQPGTPAQTCVVTNGAGTIGSAKVSDVAVTCTTNKYKIGGTVAVGLTGSGLVLKNNGADALPVTAAGPFTFPTTIASGSAYAVTVGTQPTNPSQTCAVAGGTGTVGAGDVTSVAVNCTTNKYTVGGTITGLLGTVVLQNNGGNDLTVNAAAGTFAFSTPLDSNSNYAVTVKTQPGSPSQTCTLTNDTGKVTNANVTNVALTCVTNTFKVSAKVTGLNGAGLVLQDNGKDDVSVTADGTVDFATPVASGQPFAVSVKTQPTNLSQSCVVTGNSTMGAADVVVNVTCTTNSYTVGGTIAGYTGTGLILQDNGGDDFAVPKNGTTFQFSKSILSGNTYAVTIKTPPTNPSQTCTLGSATGTVTNGNVVTVSINCTTDSFTVGGPAVTGLAGTGLVLQNNGKDDLTVTAGNAFTFGAPILSGTPYAVTVKTNPTNPSQTCSVTSNGSATMGAAKVTNVGITCTTNTYKVGGTISGLTTAGLVLQDNGKDDLIVPANATSFQFATSVASNGAYAVTVKTQPTGSACTVSSAAGTVGAGPVTDVAITCVPGVFAFGEARPALSCASFSNNGPNYQQYCFPLKGQVLCIGQNQGGVISCTDLVGGGLRFSFDPNASWPMRFTANTQSCQNYDPAYLGNLANAIGYASFNLINTHSGNSCPLTHIDNAGLFQVAAGDPSYNEIYVVDFK